MQSNPKPQRWCYPWGNEIDDEYANYETSAGGVSTPVVYFRGVSPYGCHDLAGNVWEWKRSEWNGCPYPIVGTAAWKQRGSGGSAVVLRGGAFNGYHRQVRRAVRRYRWPGDRNNLIGFRVVLFSLR